MVDLDRLAHLPDPGYTSALSSSHDRASDTADPGSTEWFANRDFVELAEGESTVLLDAQGPGTVTRIWSASPAGVIRIYIDGEADPIVEASFEDLLLGRVEPFLEPFAFVAAGGHNLYFPIPFSASCRITLTGEVPRTFFHISYRSYSPTTSVQPFGTDALVESECVRSLVADRLRRLTPGAESSDVGEWRSFSLSSADPDGAAVVQAEPGGGILRQLRFTVDDSAPGVLRATVLSIAFDGQETVRVPLGDFFASSLAIGEVNSVPIGVERESRRMSARWTMPFEHEARVALEATGSASLHAMLDVLVDEQIWSERSLVFYAQWHSPETFPSKPSRDWNLVTVEGTGLYVGNVLNVVNRTDSWWGEGDEKIYVDDEPFPSHFGTGTEDYYGYAWCSNETFSTPFVGQPRAGKYRNFGYVSLYRFHIADPIPFERSLRFDLEVRHWGDAIDVTYDAVSFWYARPGSRMLETPLSDDLFRIPEFGVPEPDAPEGPYRCGG